MMALYKASRPMLTIAVVAFEILAFIRFYQLNDLGSSDTITLLAQPTCLHLSTFPSPPSCTIGDIAEYEYLYCRQEDVTTSSAGPENWSQWSTPDPVILLPSNPPTPSGLSENVAVSFMSDPTQDFNLSLACPQINSIGPKEDKDTNRANDSSCLGTQSMPVYPEHQMDVPTMEGTNNATQRLDFNLVTPQVGESVLSSEEELLVQAVQSAADSIYLYQSLISKMSSLFDNRTSLIMCALFLTAIFLPAALLIWQQRRSCLDGLQVRGCAMHLFDRSPSSDVQTPLQTPLREGFLPEHYDPELDSMEEIELGGADSFFAFPMPPISMAKAAALCLPTPLASVLFTGSKATRSRSRASSPVPQLSEAVQNDVPQLPDSTPRLVGGTSTKKKKPVLVEDTENKVNNEVAEDMLGYIAEDIAFVGGEEVGLRSGRKGRRAVSKSPLTTATAQLINSAQKVVASATRSALKRAGGRRLLDDDERNVSDQLYHKFETEVQGEDAHMPSAITDIAMNTMSDTKRISTRRSSTRRTPT
ncbi:hypothetical protein CEUSTIGMA_g9820.t1 [Chlamydomonas eustigma]|uniref:Transmembrane protein n=1 Tax=Chlamydomonas eustigma TaxID=1157962 RepID=A0A250XHJ0_9CHLO|nr:hypothetical protein CEUSTIGMA_g9820.t1 [Chlamydomonas eustigma]|eukprot:GAX82392.1 hypothetical protein CEUSTIGMA_g9820.t1 [Chlamydomonas eustigma]